MKGIRFFIFLSAYSALTACKPSDSNRTAKNSEKDTMRLWVDSSLSVLVNEERKSFENIYFGSSILLENKNENQLIKGLLNNSISAAVLHRELSTSEVDFLQKKENFKPKQYIIAYDAYVFVCRTDNPLKHLSIKDLEAYLKQTEDKGFTLSVENSSSQSVQFLKSYFALNEANIRTLYASTDLLSLLNYVRTAKNAVALLPFSYISDIQAAPTVELLKDLKVLPLQYSDSTGKTQSVFPSQETITTKAYPLISPIVLVNCNMEEKLGTTFVNFIFKQKAQRLILKFGLCPAIFPGREIRINTN